MSYMGLDVGQTGCKAIVFNDGGTQIAHAYREYATLIPKEGWAELDSSEVCDSCFAVIREANAACIDDPVRALAISSQGEAFTPIGKNGEILSNAMITFDKRAAGITKTWSSEFGIERLYRFTGHTAHPMFSLFKLLWLRDNQPDTFQKSVKFLCFEDFIQYSLGLEPHIALSLAGRTMMFNIKTHDWIDEILDNVGIDRTRLAHPVPSGTIVGTLDPSTAKSIGFEAGVVMITGGHDQPMGALGAGVTTGGMAMYATGTSECITPAFDEPILSEELFKSNICTYDYTLQGMYTTVAFSLTGGNILKWFRDELGRPELEEAGKTGQNAYEIILRKMPDKPSSVLVLPYFTPTGTPYFDSDASGAILGLHLSTRREDMLRGLLEGVAFEMRLNLDILSKSGIEIDELRAIGGGAKSAKWTQLKADVLNKPITTVQVTEAVGFACAMFACSTVTEEPVESIVKRWVKTKGVANPNPEHAEIYGRRFETYRQLYPKLKDIRS